MSAAPTTFEMPETINGEEPPATVPFVKPASDEQAAIKQKRFNSLGESQAAYDAWCATCNWKKLPTLAFFIWASEHNWDEEDGLRIPEDDKDRYYGLAEWEEDMRVGNDDRWFMDVVSGQLIKHDDGPSSAEAEAINTDIATSESTSGDIESTDGAKEHAESPSSSHDDKFWQELEIMGQLRQAEIERQKAQTEFDIKTEERKEAKEHLASCTSRVARITAQLVSLNTLPEPKKDQPGVVKSPELATQNTGAPHTPADDSWRKEPTANIIKGLPGLGAKKLEAICEKAPTVGDLEDLRGKASDHHCQFKEMLPKGCGEAIAQAIEDALLNFIFKWKDRPAGNSLNNSGAITDNKEHSSTITDNLEQSEEDELADL